MDYGSTSNQSNYLNFKTIRPWIVWGLGCFFYFYEFLLQVSPGVMSTELMRDFNVTGQALGTLSGFYFCSYAAMQLPGGVLMDYFGPHRLLTLAATICALGAIAFGLTESFFMACIARFMIGLGSAFAAVGSMKLAANWFPPQRFAFLTGLMVTVGMLGAIGGEGPLAFLVDSYGWRESMIILGVAGLIIAILLFLIAKDTPDTQTNRYTHNQEESLWVSLMTLIKNHRLWLVAAYGGLIYLATPVFCGLWGVSFLMEKMHLSKTMAANLNALVFVGWAISSPLWGIYSNRIGLRKPPMLIGCIGALIVSLLFIYAPIRSLFLMQLLLLSFGIFSAGFLPAFTLAKELCSRRYVATGLSFMNMMNMLGVALAQPLVGYILDMRWQGNIVDKARVYPLEAYQLALGILPICIVMALMIMPFIEETFCQSLEEKNQFQPK